MNTKVYPQWLRLTAVLTLLLAALAPVSSVYADSCLVSTAADSGAGSLREKIANPACDTITFDNDYTIVLVSQLIISRNVTIDGIGHSVAISGNHAVRVFFIGSGTTVNLNNLTVANGYAGVTGFGGGIYNRSTLHVTNGAFSDNNAAIGGGIFSDGDAVTVTSSTFSGNSSSSRGGGIYNFLGTTSVENSTFTDNSAAGDGGSIYVDSGIVTVADSDFHGNNRAEMGAGIHNSGTLSVTNSAFSGNRARFMGGAISNTGTLNVLNSTFSGNYVGLGSGGGIFNNAGTAVLTLSTFSNNSAMNGGGIFNNVGTVTLINTTVSGNYAEGILNKGTLTSINSTISSNYTSGLYNNGGTATLMNTIIANHSDDFLNCVDSTNGITGSYNLTDDESCGPGFTISPSILLGPLADNGGPTLTMALLPGSAAIDAGDDAVCPITDQRGIVRPYGAHCDIGAYEAEIAASDTTPPTIILTTPAEDAVYLLGQSINADYTCQDEAGGSGLALCVGNVPNGSLIDTGSVGVKTFTVNAADNAGNTASVTHSYHVVYNFTGFTSPVDNPPVMNIAKAGQAIPLKWRITDANGNPVTDLTGVTVTAVSLSCPSSLTTDAVEEYATSNSGLQNLGDGYYQWNWKSPASYANTCKTLKLDFGEGAGFEHLALFQFRK
jgi:predicted outer membrane repeat protein